MNFLLGWKHTATPPSNIKVQNRRVNWHSFNIFLTTHSPPAK
jgi:hypothetical protein